MIILSVQLGSIESIDHRQGSKINSQLFSSEFHRQDSRALSQLKVPLMPEKGVGLYGGNRSKPHILAFRKGVGLYAESANTSENTVYIIYENMDSFAAATHD